MYKQRCAGVAAIMMLSFALPSLASAAEKAAPDAVCENQLLPYRQRYLCKQEMENIQTRAEQKKVQAKFQAMVREAEAEKAKEEK
jgi:hypothetical protein